jgi:hypothetical protein
MVQDVISRSLCLCCAHSLKLKTVGIWPKNAEQANGEQQPAKDLPRGLPQHSCIRCAPGSTLGSVATRAAGTDCMSTH